jgi:hypothetical protein
MDKQRILFIKFELLWWAITCLVIGFVLYPIYKLQPVQFPFWKTNIIFVIVFITVTRYIFFLKHTFLGYIQWLKVLVILLCIPLLFYLVEELHFFKDYMDKIGLEDKFEHLSLQGQTDIINYIDSEMIFFGVGSLISSVILPFRMLISFWRTHNRGTI